MNRETIVTALCNIVFGVAAFQTTGRRVLFWQKVDAQPACFVRHTGDAYREHGTAFPPVRTLDFEIWVYSNAGRDVEAPPDTEINNILDAIDTALAVPPGLKAQTLGGQVTHCWIEGEIPVDPGDIDGQAKALVPVRILVP